MQGKQWGGGGAGLGSALACTLARQAGWLVAKATERTDALAELDRWEGGEGGQDLRGWGRAVEGGLGGEGARWRGSSAGRLVATGTVLIDALAELGQVGGMGVGAWGRP